MTTTTTYSAGDELSPKGRDLLARRGITVDPTRTSHTDHVPDIVANRLEVLGAAIGDRIGTRFVFAETDHAATLEWVQRFLADPASAGNLLVFGPTGVGKTHLVAAVIRLVASERARDVRNPLRWAAVDHPEFNARMRPASDGRHLAALDSCQETELLFLDDVAAGMATEWTADTLYRLLNVRWSRQRPTIAASNLPPKQLRAAVDERAWERLVDDATVITLDGPSRRARRGGDR